MEATKKVTFVGVGGEDSEVESEREKPKEQGTQEAQQVTTKKYRSRWMMRRPSSTTASQTTMTWEEPERIAVKMEAMNLEAIEAAKEQKLKEDIKAGTLRQKRLEEQLKECSRNRRQASDTVTSVAAGTSCQGHTPSRRSEEEDNENQDDWQAELLHDVDQDTFGKLDVMAADLDEMATRERWLFCRSCKKWHTVPCSKTSSKFLMLSILGLLLQTRPINATGSTTVHGDADYSIAVSQGVAVYEHRYDAVLDATTSIIVVEMPFLRLRTEMDKLRTAMEKAASEYDMERDLYAGLEAELKRFEAMMNSTVELFTVKDKRKERTLAEWLGGLLGLYNTVKVKQIERKEDSTREAVKTALVHLNAMDLHEKEEEKSIGQVIDKLEDTRKLMFRGSRARQATNSWHKVRELVQAFIKVGDTAVEHRVDPALFNLVDMPAVWDKLQEELAKEGKKTAVRHYQNILQLHASFWADADTLHVAVVVPILRTEATIFSAYEVRIPPVLAGDKMAYLRTDEDRLLVHRATGTIAHTGDMDQCAEVEGTKYCNMAYVLEDKAEPSCQGAIWRSEWPEATQRCPIRMVGATATVWALEKDEFWVVLPNTTECTFTCGTKPPQTRQIKGQHRVRLGESCGMSSAHFSLRPATQADGRKITIRQAVVNFTGWQEAIPEEKIFRATTQDDGYQIRAKQQLEKGESGQNWTLIILATILGVIAAAVMAAGAAAFVFRKQIMTALLTTTLGPRAAEFTARRHAPTDDSGGSVKSWESQPAATSRKEEELEKVKDAGATKKVHRQQKKPKKEKAFDMEELTKFMISPQHSMGDAYARRKCDDCWDGKSARDDDEGVLPTICTGCKTRKGASATQAKQLQVWGRAEEMATLLPADLRPKNCAKATKKERMYIGYYFPKQYLYEYNQKHGTKHEEEFVQIDDATDNQEKEAVKYGKPY